MERVNLSDIKLGCVTHSKLSVFLDDEKNIVILPLLWLIHIYSTGSVYAWRTQGEFYSGNTLFSKKSEGVTKTLDERSVSENTIENYVGNVLHFLKYINKIHKKKARPLYIILNLLAV